MHRRPPGLRSQSGLQFALQLAAFSFDLLQPDLQVSNFLTSKHECSTALAVYTASMLREGEEEVGPSRRA